jgi:hypothetical protein
VNLNFILALNLKTDHFIDEDRVFPLSTGKAKKYPDYPVNPVKYYSNACGISRKWAVA